MIDALFAQTNYVASKKLLDVAVLRHEAISANIANAETPNYKRVDVSPTFAMELRRAIADKSVSQVSSLKPKLEVDGTAVASNRDGNTVQLDSELMRMQQNTMAHALEIQFISGSLSKIRSAITGRLT